jgi:hypothetical protein
MQAIQGLRILDIIPAVGILAAGFLESKVLPQRAATDAAQIAVAAVHGMDFLVTWNCVHIANALIAKRVAEVCLKHGFQCPVICTPEEL